MPAVVVFLVIAGVLVFLAKDTAEAAVDESKLSEKERAKLDELTPRFRPIAARVLLKAKAAGLNPFLGDAYRSLGKSAELYAAYQAGGPRAAPPGSSAHNFGEGIDINVTEGGKVPNDIAHPKWQAFGAIVRAEADAVWGGDFKTGSPDGPHVEHRDWRSLKTPVA